ncbi:Ubiquinone/menaquinone biosynthesis C-methylase UbiE [Shimia gijangensis]|uniref:Ubiquinone/menaquinone biosynthesis C-methylase UbiE n=1 Tax=Shimia gijangensis TaxID=1470563 RepID=A0A1M6U9Q3_9RHOB|nr:class I SAM-dependent methyltransferase [Shimia gijangensis]SHK65917.1 Ubiquinone/menaquinone biosynthesis C-methylase UbiE [Shimia gijangensis]
MQPNQAQALYWSSESGQKWIWFETELDLVFSAVDDALIKRAATQPGERILDIGCGTGATTRAFVPRVAPSGKITAVDISPAFVSHARDRAKLTADNTEFVVADAQSAEISGAPFDLVISRFGSMFFADPVEAFRNILKQMKPAGRLTIAAWAKAKGNPWFEAPKSAAVKILGPLDQSNPNAPGPLGFQNVEHVVGILKEAGFQNVEGETATVELAHPGPVERVAALASNIGPAARIIKKYDGSAGDIEAITEFVVADFRKFVGSEDIRIPANLNFFTAQRVG